MCRLLGIKHFEMARHRHLLERFIDLSRTGETLPGDAPGHRDGWGITWYEKGLARVHKSAGCAADQKDQFFQALEHVASSPVLIAHLRKSAWPQTTVKEHSHPFIHKKYAFAHNGTVHDFKELLPKITIKDHPLDKSLDSEIFFYYILGFVDAGFPRAIAAAARQIRENNQFSSLTSLFADGRHLYAFRDFSKFPEYYTLFHAHDTDADYFASEQILPHLSWRLLDKGELLVV